jgi:hypothetical protein
MSDVEHRISKLSPEKRALLERQLLRRKAGEAAAQIPRRAEGGPAPLSFPQQRLWFLEQLAPGEPTYNAVLAMRVGGGLAVARLERGLRTVIGRHEALRTVFRAGPDGTPQQVVLENWRFAVDVRDLTGVGADAREGEMLRQAREEARRPFDLEHDLMLRVSVLRLSADEHVLLFIEHHIAFDGWSDGQLFRELEELARAEAEHREPVLDELPIQYADWSVWQRSRLEGPALERLVGFWREALDGAPALLDLPLDHPRPPVQAFAGEHHHFALPGLAQGVRELARAEGATPFMVLLAAFSAALNRWSGLDDLVFGSPIANRDRTEIEHLIGFFSNTFVLRVKADGDPAFAELVKRARAMALAAYEHQDLPFEKLVEVVRPPRDPRANPIFQVNFRVQAGEPDVLRLPGATIEPFDLDIGFSRFDLAIEFQLREDDIHGYLEYNTALFERGTVQRLGARLARLLEDALERPDVPVGELAWDAEPGQGGIRGRRR